MVLIAKGHNSDSCNQESKIQINGKTRLNIIPARLYFSIL